MMLTKDSPLKEVLELGRINCGSCTHCCQYSSGALVDSDFQPIADFLHISVDELKEKHLEQVTKFNTTRWRPRLLRDGKPYGPCTFLTEKECSIHPVRPLQCRTFKCEERPVPDNGITSPGYDKSIGTLLDQWFALNQFVDLKDPISVAEWKAYVETSAEVVIDGGFISENDIKVID